MAKRSDAWLTLIQAVASVETEVGDILQKRFGLGLSEYRALQILARSPKSELRMQELAVHLRLNQSSVSRMVERLERGGLTVRDVCADDKRGVYTVLTDAGRARFENAREAYEKALDAAIKRNGCTGLLANRNGS